MPTALHPLWRVLTLLPGELLYFVTVGTMPEKAREKLGLKWTTRDERLLRAFGFAVSYGVSALPERLRYFPIAYQARKAARERSKLVGMLEHRPM
ncbi:oxygenase MpaB family protein [Hoyosella altamirensis]|nr:oxygenase MpaB family protein [Hoyosella altamirensis]